MRGKIADVRSALETNDADQIRSSTDALNEAMQKLGQAVYGQSADGQSSGEAKPSGDEGTVEGEFREV